MHKFLISSLTSSVLLLTFNVNAEPGFGQSVNIPANISSNILKRHPTAQELQGIPETHFGQRLLEVSFKVETGESIMELFTESGHLFTNEVQVESIDAISQAAIHTLKTEFPGFTLQKAELIGNPNGVGEEYEIYLTAKGIRWRVSINDLGTIVDKQQY